MRPRTRSGRGVFMNVEPLMPLQLEQLRSLSTCVVASAIETFGVRLRNKGFSDSRLHCIFEDLPTTVGYAATARIRSADPPMEGHSYYDRGAWWDSLLKIPAPRVVIIEDVDSKPGLGAFIGEVHANILLALGCVAVVTNGAVRDLPDFAQERPATFRRKCLGVARLCACIRFWRHRRDRRPHRASRRFDSGRFARRTNHSRTTSPRGCSRKSAEDCASQK